MRERNVLLMAVAVAFHLPGLKILFNRTPSRGVVCANVVALVLTGIGACLAFAVGGVWVMCAAWFAGHLLWGLYLARLSIQRGSPISLP
jgi:hypothetical protein